MSLRMLLVSALTLGAIQPALAYDLPSGLDAELNEVLLDDVSGKAWVRFRFVAPAINRDLPDAPDYFALSADFSHICTHVALPYLADYALSADVVVVSLADRPVEFGKPNPDATQFFEQFRLEAGDCIWEEI